MGFAVGDRVVCLRNDRRMGVINGTVGTVERAVGSGLAITTDDGDLRPARRPTSRPATSDTATR